MNEITLHQGEVGDRTKLRVEWHDADQNLHHDFIEINVRELNSKRAIEVRVNGVTVSTFDGEGTIFTNLRTEGMGRRRGDHGVLVPKIAKVP